MNALKSEGECFEKFKDFKALVKTQSKNKFKVFRSDNGGEFVSKAFNCSLNDHGIKKQTFTMYIPQQNEVTEHANHIIVEMSRIHIQNHDISSRVETVADSVYIREGCLTRALDSITSKKI